MMIGNVVEIVETKKRNNKSRTSIFLDFKL